MLSGKYLLHFPNRLKQNQRPTLEPAFLPTVPRNSNADLDFGFHVLQKLKKFRKSESAEVRLDLKLISKKM